MGRLDHYSPEDRERIKNLAVQIIEGQIEKGKIPCTEEAIRAAMPDAVECARATITAIDEFLS